MQILASIGLAVLMIGGIAIIGIPLALMRGWALSVLWGWFMVPLFHLPPLAIAQAIGVGLVVTTFSPPGGGDCQKSKDYKWYNPLLYGFIGPLLGVGMGYIVKGWL